METRAAALIRRTDTPSWPNCLRQLKVASTNASRRTAGVARWNFGTCRLDAICFLFLDYSEARPNGAGRSKASESLRRPVADKGSDALGHVAPDVQVPVFHRRIVSLGVAARPNPNLHTLAYRPILPVHQIPEFHGIRRIKAGLRHFMALEQEMAGDIGAFGAAWLQDERRHVIAGHAQEQIGVDQFALVPYLFVCIETGKGAPHGGPAMREGIRPLTVRNSTAPIQIGAAGLAKRGHHRAQLRVNSAAVVALVVVFTEDFPIRRNFVTNGRAYAQIAHRTPLQPIPNAAQLLSHPSAPARR